MDNLQPEAIVTTQRSRQLARIQIGVLLVLFFASGAAALIYQVLWLRELGRLFGATAYAAATTLAVFFLGLSAGGLVWGRRAERLGSPLRTYALLELGVAATALAFFGLLDLYRWIYQPLFSVFGDQPLAFLVVKFLLATGTLFLPAFFMGGTLPVMGQFLVRSADELGRKASLLYAINTAGAAAGALAAGFYLPLRLGFRNSYLVAIALNGFIAAVAFLWSRYDPQSDIPKRDSSEVAGDFSPPDDVVKPSVFWGIAFLSGFLTLGLEVLWTRMFAQVLQNSVYTFAVVLTVFLVALALGSVLANLLCRCSWSPPTVLFVLLALAGFLVGLTPLVFYRLTSGVQFLAGDLGWTSYIAFIFKSTALVLLVPVLVMGSVFPYLLKLGERSMRSAGRTIGELVSVNTVAAIVGSVAAGFVLLNLLGLWTSIRFMAIVYLLLAVVVLPGRSATSLALRSFPILGVVLFTTLLTYPDLAKVHLDSAENEKLVQSWEGGQGTVAVIDRGGDLRLRVDNSYVLGTSRSAMNLRLQSWLPLSLHPSPRSVFFLGMGTGITAGAALDFPVEKVTVCEIHPDVVRAGRAHFGPYVNGLFDDRRVEILIEDGRAYLYGTRELFDVIISEIFLTYKQGTGSLYTREHFEAIRERLEPGGHFVQWLTLFDQSRLEFGIIAATMLEVFPQVSLWRRGFSPRFPVFALVGANETAPLDNQALQSNLERLGRAGVLPSEIWIQNIPHAAYAGNLSAMRSRFEGFPISTDDRPLVEYLAPITERNSRGSRADAVLAWSELGDFCQELLSAVPPREDPYLSALDVREKNHVLAGLAFYKSEAYRRMGLPQQARAQLQEYKNLLMLPSGR